MNEQGVMRLSKGPLASPVHIVPKENGNLPPCGDYRGMNARTVPHRYPPPNPHSDDFRQHLHSKRIFSIIDLIHANH